MSLLFLQSAWNEKLFKDLLQKYPIPVDRFFHRMTQILPKHLGIKELFYLHNVYDRTTKRNEIVRELHLSKPHAPHRMLGSYEHPCSQWLVHRLTKSHLETGLPQMGLQSSFSSETENRYLVAGMSVQNEFTPNKLDSFSISLDITFQLKGKISWTCSSEISNINIGETCERCLLECLSRQAPLQPKYNHEQYAKIMQTIESFNI